MSRASAVNVAMGLVLIGYWLIFYGVASQMGDPAPWVTQEALASRHRMALAVWWSGVAMLLGALALAVWAWPYARWRASLVILACLAPPLCFVVSWLWLG